jgi:hypothetical protein
MTNIEILSAGSGFKYQLKKDGNISSNNTLEDYIIVELGNAVINESINLKNLFRPCANKKCRKLIKNEKGSVSCSANCRKSKSRNG